MGTIAPWKGHVNRNLLNNPAVAGLLSKSAIEQHCRDLGHRWRASFWSPTTTVITFLLQVLDGAKTLRSAVAILLTQLAADGQEDLPSPDATAYCQARIRLPEALLPRLAEQASERMRELVTSDTGWLGHRVWMVDGSNVSMPDTPALQAAFPQPSGQKPGCGFPVAQIVALFCWTTGAIRDVVVDTWRPHELTLVRRLHHHFEAGDVLLADRAYCAYVDMARLAGRGVYCVCRLHQRRKADFRHGKRLGPDDRRVVWPKPVQWLPSCGISREAFDSLPATLPVRLIRIAECPPGFRSRTLFVVTTLLDPVETPADAVRALYRDRWTAELNLRSLKTAMQMEVLRGMTPDVVGKEIAMHLLAYNLIRLMMWHAARSHGCDLHRLSFTGTLHRLRHALPLLIFKRAGRTAAGRLTFLLMAWLADDTIPDRPNRIEPRRVKRRPKQYSRLVKPRRWYRRNRDTGAR
jgi:hypothetical protein